MRPVFRLAAALVLLPPLLLPAACGDGLPSSDGGAVWGDGTWHGTMDTLEDGTVVVRNPKEGIWTEEQARRIEERLRIGAATGKGPEVFGRITALAVDSLDRIWVADAQAGELRVFRPDGRHVRTVGGPGEGPGELSWPVGLVVTAGGRLLTVDLGNTRYTVFDTAGAFVADHPRRRPAVHALPWRLGPVPGGRLVDVGLVPGAERTIGAGGHTRVPARLVVLDEVFSVEATHPFLPPRDDHFAPDRVWAVDRRGHLWFGREDRYRIVQRRLEGDTVRVVTRDVEPVPYEPEEREEMAARVRSRTGQVRAAAGGDGDGGGGADVAAGDMPEHRPLFEALWRDDRGRLWVAPRPTDGGSLVEGFDVFDPDGRYLGRVRTEAPLRGVRPVPVVRGGTIYAVTEDSLEVPYVVRGRIVRPDGG